MSPPTNTYELHGPMMQRLGLPLMRILFGILFFFLGPFKCKGKYRVPRSGGLLILSNHIADVDPIIVQMACPRNVYFMAKSELFDMKLIGPGLRLYKVFPVKRGEPDKAAIRRAVDLLNAGHTVCIFPEGELSETGELIPLKPGVALIIRMTGVPVICVGLKNSNRVLPYGKVLPRPAFRWITANWGETRTFAKDADNDVIMGWAEAQLRELTDQVIED
ncbi:MAG: 1-acyl-sn-glycerol-3-phosphate acyltransferase [Armatimonadetes bacterium]|nr:1-acyl-sn-glycerol-3-phosphate acyltransferase [Armatimonadota bacterium]